MINIKKAFDFISKEISQLIISIGKGFSYVFVTIPKKIFKIGNKKTANEQANTNNTATNQTNANQANANQEGTEKAASNTDTNNTNKVVYNKKGFLGNLNDKFENWYNNLSFVKAKREKYEASLVPYVLNPEVDSVKSDKKVMYKYLARRADGKIIEEYFPAFSKMDVYSYLTDEKMTVYKIETNKNINFVKGQSGLFQTKMKTKDLVFWLTQLSTYIKAGIPLIDSVKVLAQQDKRKKYKSIYEAVIYELTMGQTFSDALAKQGNAFPGLLVNMIKSSEMTGSIEETLDEMSDYYKDIEETKRAVVSACTYPAIVLIFAGIIVIFMLTFIVPKFVGVYESMGSEIPKITQITLSISHFLQTKYMYLIGGIVGFIIIFTLLFKKVKAFRTFIQSILMRLPVIGKLLIAKEMSMFARTFASLQKNNVLLTDSIDILSKITSNEVYKELEHKTIENLIKGNKMSETFKDHWAIPDIAYFMITTGESTGELAEMLEKVADFYSKEEKNIVGTIKTFIEPFMILFLSVIVGCILVSVLIPMFGIYETVA